jgi:threonine/homoserine/homoserine lactone efflux protein
MGQAIGQVLGYGVGVALSPLPIIAMVLLLATPKGRTNGPAFLLGWILGIAIVGGLVLAFVGGSAATSSGAPSTGSSWLKIILGVALLGLAARQWRGRPQGDTEPEMPKWMQALDSITPAKAVGLGALLSGVNPKNLILTVGAAAAIAQTDASNGSQIVALIVFIVIGSLGVGTPVAIYFGMGDRSATILANLRGWMTHNNAAIMVVLCLIIGAKLIGDGITGLSLSP